MSDCIEKCILAKKAEPDMARLSSDKKNSILKLMADYLEADTEKIITANIADVENARKNGTSEAIIDRLMLNSERISDMADAIRKIASYDDPVNKIIDSWVRPNGMKITRVTVPMGVIGVVYEARPNVTTDVASLIIKAGSVVVLRGSASAINSNRALVVSLKRALSDSDVTGDIIQLIEDTSHDSVSEMAHAREYIDLIIPRGGASLIKAVVNDSSVPVIETGLGNCHVYVDEFADYDMAERIVINAKTQRPSVCNAAETLLVHEKWANKYLEKLLDILRKKSVKLFGCKKTVEKYNVYPATEKDWAEEYLDLALAVKIVESCDEAIVHIRKYSTHHTETIVTECDETAEKFMNEVDAAAVNWNVSGRMTDGGMYGFGAEIGISTQKLHARGPMGLNELVSYKYKVTGNGQIRE